MAKWAEMRNRDNMYPTGYLFTKTRCLAATRFAEIHRTLTNGNATTMTLEEAWLKKIDNECGDSVAAHS